jgi:hypothetical protein
VGGVRTLKKFILIGLGILGIAYLGVYIYLDKWGPGSETKLVVSQQEQDEVKAELAQSFETSTPPGEMPKYEAMTETELLDEVHGMTHQKVEADQKWGSSEITRDKVEKMYDEVNRKKFKEEEIRTILLDILKPWTKGDFSHAVENHNTIWNYLNGNVGEAKRLLTPVEEQEYIAKNFR